MSLINELIKSAKLAKQGKKVVVNPKPFFSAVDKAALDLQRAKGTGKEFMTELKKTKGVKPNEIENRKLAQIEEMPKMTKDQFIDELEKRPPVKISETVLPEGTSSVKDEYAQSYFDQDYYDLDLRDREYIDNMMAKYGKDAQGYDYHLPGGENYREILLQLPHFSASKIDDLMAAEARSRRNPGNLLLAHDVEALKAERASYDEPYIHEHWGSENPNILAHMRVQDRLEEQPPEMRYVAFNKNSGFPSPDFATPEELDAYIKTLPANIQNSLVVKQAQIAKPPRKILHVEEIQSDWHQEGRKKGYQQEIKPRNLEVRKTEDGNFGVFDADKNAFISSHLNQESAEKYLQRTVSERPTAVVGVPDAPFKKNWHELAMKRLLNYASENGYDGIAITPGKLQIDRYEEALRKNLDNLEYESYQNPDTGKTVYELSGSKNGQQVFSKEDLTPEEVKDLVGKDMFAKMEAGQGKSLAEERPLRPAWMRLEGDDISIGGEGMKGFYDKMIPDYLNTFGKKYGSQVELNAMPIENKLTWREELQNVHQQNPENKIQPTKQLHYFKITPEMREEVKQGMPLYQQVGVPIGAGAAGAEIEVPQPVQEEEPAFAAGGIVFNTNPDMSDGGRIIQGAPFKRGGKVHVAQNSDTMFMEMNDKKPNLTKRSSGLINVKRK